MALTDMRATSHFCNSDCAARRPGDGLGETDAAAFAALLAVKGSGGKEKYEKEMP